MHGPAPHRERRLWRAYQLARVRFADLTHPRRIAARNRLMLHYLPLLENLAQRMARKVPDIVAADELAAQGFFGLAHAIESFDPNRNTRFATFAGYAVVGAMRDHLRGLDPLPRLTRSRHRRLEAARATLYARTGRPATDDELRDHLGLSAADYARLRGDASPPAFHRLDAPRDGADRAESRGSFADAVEDCNATDPARNARLGSLRELVLADLSRAERLIVVLYYYERLTLREIGQVLDLSESRVSQLLSSILARLRARLHDRADEFVGV